MKTRSAHKSTLVETFGDTPLIKTLDFFLMYPDFDYSKNQVSKETGVSRMTLDKIWKRLLRKNVITKTRDVGRGNMYKLNTGNPEVKAMMRFDTDLSYAAVKEDSAKAQPVSRRRG